MLRFAIISFALLPTSSFAEERWSEYWACEQNVLENVEIAEPSVWDGARLIVDALCISVATDLVNDMVRLRDYYQGFDSEAAFESARHVVRRETAIKLYNRRVLRLGLRRN